ncbi:hypothetical protein HNP81_001015 [Peribacillus huizhouensis]|uniref:Uncharacterized protein n=1 Tax=Peribacillus huizhouensis TaxID=1501239 RepID=A0ABR6CL01_9BACI|nr:hypothetical protein [Peribacillus huizhouensis]
MGQRFFHALLREMESGLFLGLLVEVLFGTITVGLLACNDIFYSKECDV